MQKKSAVLTVTGIMLTLLAILLFSQPEPVSAIPAFARKYSMSCTTCHAPVPRLKAYGDEFAGNGFVLKDKEATRYFMATGDDRLNLIRDLPVALRLEGYVKHQTETGRETDFSSPYKLKFLSGGSLTDNVAYYFVFFLTERGEVIGLEDALFIFNDIIKGQDLDFYIGQFQAADPLFKSDLRLTYENYQIYRTKVVPGSTFSLAYDRGIMLTYGLPTGTDIILEVLNGNGIDEADDYKVYDKDKYKNIAGRISQDIGENLRLGVYGLYGKETLIAEPDPDLYPGSENVYYKNEGWIAGPDMTVIYKDIIEFNAQYLERRDDIYTFDKATTREVETRGGLAELIFMPFGDRSRWYLTALYNKIDSDLDNADYETFTAHIGYVMRTNIRLLMENTYDINKEENRVVIGFVAAF